jgi:hypothetical protein
MSQVHPAAPPAPRSPIGYNLAIIAMAMVGIGLAGAYGIDALVRAHHRNLSLDGSVETLTRTIGGRDLTIPVTWFRYGEQGAEGFASQIDLQLELALGADGANEMIDVTLVPRSRARPSASLLDGVYLHQFMDGQLDGPQGLVGKPLKASDGYQSESVWYDALSGDPFVAKCAAPVEAEAPSRCVRTVILESGIAAIYTFDVSALASWRTFDTAMAVWLKRIGAI